MSKRAIGWVLCALGVIWVVVAGILLLFFGFAQDSMYDIGSTVVSLVVMAPGFLALLGGRSLLGIKD